MAVATTRFSTPMFSAQAPRIACAGPAPNAAEAVFAGAKALLSSREAHQMSVSDLERELYRRHQELVRKLLQEHRGQRSPSETAGPADGAGASGVGASDVGCSEQREHERHPETPSRTVHVPRPGCALRGLDGLHLLHAALHLPPARDGVEVRRRTTIATALRAPPHTPPQFTALDISHVGGLVRAAMRCAAPVRRRGPRKAPVGIRPVENPRGVRDGPRGRLPRPVRRAPHGCSAGRPAGPRQGRPRPGR